MDAFNFDALKSALLGPVQRVVDTKDERTEAALIRLHSAVEEVADKIDKLARAEAESAKAHAAAAIGTHKDSFKKGGGEKSLAKLGENVWGSRKALQRIVKMGASPRTFWVGVGHYHAQALNQLTAAFKAAGCCGGSSGGTEALMEIAKSTAKTGAASKVGGLMAAAGDDVGGGPGGGAGATMNALGHSGKAWAASILSGIGSILTSSLATGFEINLSDAFNGAFRAANQFRMEIRGIQQATEGFVEANRALEPTFDGLYHTIRASGLGAKDVFALISKAQKIGIRDAKVAQSIVGTATNTASILGMEAGVVNDIFMSWHQQLGLSTMEIATMGQSMKEIAKQSGVMGKRLENALATSDKIAEKLRNAGVFTATAGRNVTAMTVEFEKFGVGPAGAKILDALSSRHSFLETDPITRGYMERIARQSGNPEIQQRVRGGTLLHSTTASKEFFGAMEKDMRRMLGHFGPAIEGVFAKSGRKLDLMTVKMEDIPEIFRVLEEQGEHQLYGVVSDLIKRQTGLDVGEITRMAEAGQLANKTTGERIKDMEKELAGFVKGTDNYIQKEKQILSAKINERQAGFTELTNLQKNREKMGLKNDADFEEALVKRLKQTMGEGRAKEFTQNISGEASKMMQGMTKRAENVSLNAGKIVRELGGYRSMDELAAGVAKGDKNAQDTMSGLLQRIEQQEKVAADPIMSIKDNVKAIHDWLTTGIFGLLKRIGDTALSILGWTAFLAPVAFHILGIWKVMSLLSRAKNFIGNLMGGGAGARTLGPAVRSLETTIKSIGPRIMTAIRGIGPWFMNTLRTIGPMLLEAGSWLSTTLRSLGPMLLQAGGWILTSLRNLGPMLLSWTRTGIRVAGPWLMTALRAVGTWLMTALRTIGPWLMTALRTIGPWLMTALRTIGPWLMTALRTIGPWLMTALRTIGPWLMTVIRSVGPWLMTALRTIGPLLLQAGGWIVSALGEVAATLGAAGIATVLAAVELIRGAVMGGMDAKSHGMDTMTGVGFGALTGKLDTGASDFIRDLWNGKQEPGITVGKDSLIPSKIIKGSNADEGLGMAQAAGRGAALGAAIGALGGPPGIAAGAAIGAVVGQLAELAKVARSAEVEIAKNIEAMEKQPEAQKAALAGIKKEYERIEDPTEKLIRYKEQLEIQKKIAGGQEKNIKIDTKELDSRDTWYSGIWGLDTGYKQQKAMVEDDLKKLKVTQDEIMSLEQKISEIENMAPNTASPSFVDSTVALNNAVASLEPSKEQAETIHRRELLPRGEMATNTMNYDDIEDVAAKQVYGESPDGSAMILPSMDAIAEYLTTTQFQLLESMVSLMEAIKSNTTGGPSSTVIGTDGVASRVSMRPGVKSIARDLTRGKWDLTFADNAPGAVTTEGRGGSA